MSDSKIDVEDVVKEIEQNDDLNEFKKMDLEKKVEEFKGFFKKTSKREMSIVFDYDVDEMKKILDK